MSRLYRYRDRFGELSWWAVSIVLATVLTAAVTWKVTTSLTDNSKTKVYEYAYNSDGVDKPAADGAVNCWVNGLGGRTDVYKCMQENKIYAPCFRDIKDMSDKVKCPVSPRTDPGAKYFEATFSKETEPLMTEYGLTPEPWHIYLSTGEDCSFLYGATEVVANRRMDFGCKNSPVTLYLPLTDIEGVSSIGCMKYSRLEQCRISEIWQ